ncbi:MAG: hypothetical protein AAFX93_09240 [Verrucomicrobiota bacterium]
MRSNRQLKAKLGRPRGAILMIVLGFIFLTAVVVVAILESVTRSMRSAATAAARDDLRLEAFSAMQVAIASLGEIKELDGNLHSASQLWGNPIAYSPVSWPDSMQVYVTIVDETGKIPLVDLDRDKLRDLFGEMGIDFTDADELIDAYLDWVDDDDEERLNGAEERYYDRLDPPIKPPNEPITSFDSFRYIKGFDELFFDENGTPNELFKQFKESVSFRHSYDINVNSASDMIIDMLSENSGLNKHIFEDQRVGLDGIANTPDDSYITSQDELESMGFRSGEGYGFEARVFRVSVEVRQGEKVFQLEALVEDGGGQRQTPDDDAEPDKDDDNDKGKSGVYKLGDWTFLELSENGSEDG